MRPRYVTAWLAHRVVDTDDNGEVTEEVTLELGTDRGKVLLVLTPEVAANVGYDLIGEGCGFAYNTITEDAEG